MILGLVGDRLRSGGGVKGRVGGRNLPTRTTLTGSACLILLLRAFQCFNSATEVLKGALLLVEAAM